MRVPRILLGANGASDLCEVRRRGEASVRDFDLDAGGNDIVLRYIHTPDEEKKSNSPQVCANKKNLIHEHAGLNARTDTYTQQIAAHVTCIYVWAGSSTEGVMASKTSDFLLRAPI